MEKTKNITLKCFAYRSKKDNRCYAFCLELNLAVQAKTLSDAHQKLSDNIRLYLISELKYNKEHNIAKFPYRRSPFSVYVDYYKVYFFHRIMDNYQQFKWFFNTSDNTINLCRV